MSDTLVTYQLEPKEIDRLVSKIAPVLHMEDTNLVSAACLAIAITAQYPDVPAEDLAQCVQSVSEYIALNFIHSDLEKELRH